MSIDIGKPIAKQEAGNEPSTKRRKWEISYRIDYVEPMYLTKVLEFHKLPNILEIKGELMRNNESLQFALIHVEKVMEIL